MFDASKLYYAAENCDTVDLQGFIDYVNSFKNVIIWGAGFLGNEMGKKFIDLNLNLTEYWDIRAEEINVLNGIPVKKSFEQKYDPENSVFIFCITNSFVRDRLKIRLKDEGYKNVLEGEYLYQGLICEAVDYNGFNKCRNSLACDAYTCNRNENFLPKSVFKDKKEPDDSLFFRNVTIVINQRCTLKCKYCYSYTNSYQPEQRINFPLKRILKDIDLFFDAVDGVKFIPLIGGETFLFHELSVIVKKILEKKNFGLLNVTTNGIVKMKPEQFEGMLDERVQLVFSNYKESLSEKQNELYDKNIEFAKSMGIHVIESNSTPTWSIPTSLSKKDYSIELMKKKRSTCNSPLNCKYLKNGRFYPCTVADSIHNIGVADYPGDYVELDSASNSYELRNQISKLVQKDYFLSCGHCEGWFGQTGLTAKAGVQGYYEFINS